MKNQMTINMRLVVSKKGIAKFYILKKEENPPKGGQLSCLDY